jgi:hypothetical protein
MTAEINPTGLAKFLAQRSPRTDITRLGYLERIHGVARVASRRIGHDWALAAHDYRRRPKYKATQARECENC